MKPQRIQLSRKKGWRMPENTVKVDRTSRWGNPFKVGDNLKDVAMAVLALADLIDGQRKNGGVITREMSVSLFRAFLVTKAGKLLLDDAKQVLSGKNLACWCKPGEPCHADVWLDEINKP